ncbi:hypothetical protein WA158_000535 [Blastocystis sp. Blastoise]
MVRNVAKESQVNYGLFFQPYHETANDVDVRLFDVPPPKEEYLLVLGMTTGPINKEKNFYMNTMKALLMYPEVLLVLFTDTKEWCTIARSLGIRYIYKPVLNEYNIPFLTPMLQTLESNFNGYFYGFINSDILVGQRVIDIFISGRRINVVFPFNFEIPTNKTEYEEFLVNTVYNPTKKNKNIVYHYCSADLFIHTKGTYSYDDLYFIVIARNGYDTLLMDVMGNDPTVSTVTLDWEAMLVHQTGKHSLSTFQLFENNFLYNLNDKDLAWNYIGMRKRSTENKDFVGLPFYKYLDSFNGRYDKFNCHRELDYFVTYSNNTVQVYKYDGDDHYSKDELTLILKYMKNYKYCFVASVRSESYIHHTLCDQVIYMMEAVPHNLPQYPDKWKINREQQFGLYPTKCSSFIREVMDAMKYIVHANYVFLPRVCSFPIANAIISFSFISYSAILYIYEEAEVDLEEKKLFYNNYFVLDKLPLNRMIDGHIYTYLLVTKPL